MEVQPIYLHVNLLLHMYKNTTIFNEISNYKTSKVRNLEEVDTMPES